MLIRRSGFWVVERLLVSLRRVWKFSLRVGIFGVEDGFLVSLVVVEIDIKENLDMGCVG